MLRSKLPLALLALAGLGVLTRAGRGPAIPSDPLSGPPEVFERRLAALTAGDGGALASLDGAALAAELAVPGDRATRAAVLLSWMALGGDGQARTALLTRLEQRAEAPSRALDAADVVAAAGLARLELDTGEAGRLAGLADGEPPHPDLEVRVECAAAALRAGREEVVPFLLRVLRSGTPREVEDPPDWPRKTTLTWAKSRAAEALSRRAGLPCTFRADGSFEHQAREADALEAALR